MGVANIHIYIYAKLHGMRNSTYITVLALSWGPSKRGLGLLLAGLGVKEGKFSAEAVSEITIMGICSK